jgi:hypothetical protein
MVSLLVDCVGAVAATIGYQQNVDLRAICIKNADEKKSPLCAGFESISSEDMEETNSV